MKNVCFPTNPVSVFFIHSFIRPNTSNRLTSTNTHKPTLNKSKKQTTKQKNMAPSPDVTNDIYGPPGPPVTSVFGAAGSPAANGGAGNGVGSLLRTQGAGSQTVSHGSRTITINATETNEEGSADEDDQIHGVLSLTGEPGTERRVQWDDDVIDNEHLNKKKSKSKRFPYLIITSWTPCFAVVLCQLLHHTTHFELTFDTSPYF